MESNMKNRKGPFGNKKANRILYIAVAAVVCVGVVAFAIVLANQNNEPTVPGTNNPDIPTGGHGEEDQIPSMMAPAVGLVSKKHDMETLVYSNTTEDWRVHKGIDITTGMGAQVMAAAKGKITAIEDDPLYGKTVVITHSGGAVTRYANLSGEMPQGIAVGAEVTGGQVIGTVGETAGIEIAEEPHLHFEMTVGGQYVDPLEYILENSQQASLNQDVSYEG